MGMNMQHRSLAGPVGWLFMRRVRRDNRQLFAWTVNSEWWMEWCIRRNNACRTRSGGSGGQGQGQGQGRSLQGEKLIDGVITDDPELFVRVCERWEDEQDGKLERPRRGVLDKCVAAISAAALSVGVHIVVMLLLARNFYHGRLDFFKPGDDEA